VFSKSGADMNFKENGMEENEFSNKATEIDVVAYMRDIIDRNGEDCLEENFPFSGKDAMMLFSCFQKIILVEVRLLNFLMKKGIMSDTEFKAFEGDMSGLIQRVDEFAVEVLGRVEENSNG